MAGARIRALQGLLPRPLLATALSAHQPHIAFNRCDSRQWQANRTIILWRTIVRAGTMFANPTSIFRNAPTQAASGRPAIASFALPTRAILQRPCFCNTLSECLWLFHPFRRADVTC